MPKRLICPHCGRSFDVRAIADAAKRVGISRQAMHQRLKRHGRRALTMKKGQGGSKIVRRITHQGETLTVSEWAMRIGIQPQTLRRRLKNMSVSAALGHVVRGPKARTLTDGRSVAEAAREAGITTQGMYYRLRRGID